MLQCEAVLLPFPIRVMILHLENRGHAVSECIMAIAINTTQDLVNYLMGSGPGYRAVLRGLDFYYRLLLLHSVFYKHQTMKLHRSDNPCPSVWSCEQSHSSLVPSLSLPSDAPTGSKTSTPQLFLKVDLSKGSSKSHHSYKAMHLISSHENDLPNKSSDKDSGAAILDKHDLSAKHHLKDSYCDCLIQSVARMTLL